jgi:flagellar protein FliO/FliZ
VSEGTLAFLRLAVALPLVLLLCVVLLKYLVPRMLSGMAGARRMRVVEQLSLGPKTGMSLVRVGGRYYLLAYHEGAVTVVKEMDELPEVFQTETPDEGDGKGDSPPKGQRGQSPWRGKGDSPPGGSRGGDSPGTAAREPGTAAPAVGAQKGLSPLGWRALYGRFARFRAGRGR